MDKVREVIAYQDHFENFLKKQTVKVQNKIFKVIDCAVKFQSAERLGHAVTKMMQAIRKEG